jgi:hypothetical protein
MRRLAQIRAARSLAQLPFGNCRPWPRVVGKWIIDVRPPLALVVSPLPSPNGHPDIDLAHVDAIVVEEVREIND